MAQFLFNDAMGVDSVPLKKLQIYMALMMFTVFPAFNLQGGFFDSRAFVGGDPSDTQHLLLFLEGRVLIAEEKKGWVEEKELPLPDRYRIGYRRWFPDRRYRIGQVTVRMRSFSATYLSAIGGWPPNQISPYWDVFYTHRFPMIRELPVRFPVIGGLPLLFTDVVSVPWKSVRNDFFALFQLKANWRWRRWLEKENAGVTVYIIR